MRLPKLLLSLGLLGALALSVLLAVPQPPGPPRLVVMIVIDQLRFDYLTRFDRLFQGGFRTLLDQGALFTQARFRHAMLLTSPGHAVLATGQHPSHHGVTANNWYDPIRKRRVAAVWDPRGKAVGGAGAPASPRTLLADTLGDRLKGRYPEARVVGVSLKDRSALLLAGRKADAAYWFSTGCGCFVTSSYYSDQPPAWLAAFNQRKTADQYYGETWDRLLDDPDLYRKHAREDNFAAENYGERNTFPHKFRSRPPDSAFYADLADSGLGDEIVLTAALAAIEGHELGGDDTPDLLGLSFAGTDRVGHAFGPFSQEAMDQILRLDRVLGRLFREIDDRVGLDRTVIALAADHGGLPLVEHLEQQGLAGERIPKAALPDAVDRAVRGDNTEVGNVVAYFDPPHIFFDLERLQQLGISRAEAEERGRQALLDTGFVEEVYIHDDMQRPASAKDLYGSLYRHSFYAPRSQHLMVRLKKHHYVDGSQGSSGHGTPYDYDRHVPLMFMGPAIRPGRHDLPCGPEDLAPTLAKMLGIDMPLETDSKLLREVLP